MENLIKTVKSDVFLVPVCVGDNVRLVDLKRFGSLYFGEYESSKAVGKAIIQRKYRHVFSIFRMYCLSCYKLL